MGKEIPGLLFLGFLHFFLLLKFFCTGWRQGIRIPVEVVMVEDM
jgi:hypothetical protein